MRSSRDYGKILYRFGGALHVFTAVYFQSRVHKREDCRLLAAAWCPTVMTKPQLCVSCPADGAAQLREACRMPRCRSCIPSGLQEPRVGFSRTTTRAGASGDFRLVAHDGRVGRNRDNGFRKFIRGGFAVYVTVSAMFDPAVSSIEYTTELEESVPCCMSSPGVVP